MIGYNYTDAEMQPPDDEDVYTEMEERLVDVLENAGFETFVRCLEGSSEWIDAINALITEQQERRNQI